MLEALGALAVLVAVGVAWRQSRRAVRAELALERALEALPKSIAKRDIGITVAMGTGLINAAPQESLSMTIECADLDCDGKEEVIIQHPAGAHGSQLRVFAWRHGKFAEVGALSVGTPGGFDLGDFDGDGQTEIKAEEVDWAAGKPYVTAPRIQVLYRWDGERFSEVSRRAKSV
jgi:hypothetical protein